METLAYVVLHYLAPDDTRACVDSLIARAGTAPPRIVVVDNDSPDGSGAALERAYAGRPGVRVVRQAANLGFARGHNVGLRFARTEWGADFVALLNNDILMRSDDFAAAVCAEYRRRPFAVLGPDILSRQTGKHQNPRKVFFDTPEKVRRNLAYLRRIDILSRLGLDRPYLALHDWARGWRDRRRAAAGAPRPAARPAGGVLDAGWMLFGACLVLAPDYLRQFDGLHEGTFLYLEEEILACRCRARGLPMVYFPQVTVEHAEQAATRRQARGARARELFRLHHLIRSNRELLKVMAREQAAGHA